jgi:hypothetical protein
MSDTGPEHIEALVEKVLALRVENQRLRIQTISMDRGNNPGRRWASEQARWHWRARAGRARPISQGGDTGSNPVGAALCWGCKWAVVRVRSPRWGEWRTPHHEAPSPHPRTDRPTLGRGREASRRRPDGRRGRPAARDHRVDMAPLAKPVRRHEGRRRQGVARAAQREPAPEEDRGRPVLGQRHVEGAEPGNF